MDKWSTDIESLAAQLSEERWVPTLWAYSAGHSSVELTLRGTQSGTRIAVLLMGASQLMVDTHDRETELHLARTDHAVELWGRRLFVNFERLQWKIGDPSPMVDPRFLEELARQSKPSVA